jgi:hypothetical protein
MQSDRLETIFRRDLDRLPGLTEDEWIPSSRRGSPQLGIVRLAALVAAVLLAIGVGLSLQAIRLAQPYPESGVATFSNQPFIVAQAGSPPPSSHPSSPLALPVCPRGQAPLLDVSYPPPPGTVLETGAANPEAAFRRARPDVGVFVIFPFGESLPASGWDDPRLGRGPIWIVAGNENLVVMRLGGPDQKWFAYPARFIECMTPPSPRQPPSPTAAPSRSP